MSASQWIECIIGIFFYLSKFILQVHCKFPLSPYTMCNEDSNSYIFCVFFYGVVKLKLVCVVIVL